VDGFEPLAQADLIGGSNMVANGSFEVDATGFNVTNGTLTRDTTRFVAGVAAGKLTAHATLSPSEVRPTGLQFEGQAYYSASAKIYIPSGLGITASNVTLGVGLTGGSESLATAAAVFDQWQTLISPPFFTLEGGATNFFGKATFGTSSKVRAPANTKFASPFVLTESGVVLKLSVELDHNYEDFGAPQPQDFQGFVYADSGGSPGALLGSSDVVNGQSPAVPVFVDLPFSTPLALAAWRMGAAAWKSASE
jgi:hypothetical protein